MARTKSTKSKAGKALAVIVNNEATDSSLLCTTSIQHTLQLAVALSESVTKLREAAADTCLRTLNHANQYGDWTLADKFIKSFPVTTPTLRIMRDGMVAFFRKNSPIRWAADGSCKLAKEGEPGYRPFDPETAESEPFYEMPVFKKAEGIANEAAAKALKPATLENLTNRVHGLKAWFASLSEPNSNGQIRGIKEADKAKMEAAINAVIKAYDEVVPQKAA